MKLLLVGIRLRTAHVHFPRNFQSLTLHVMGDLIVTVLEA